MPVLDLTRYIVASSGIWTNPDQDQEDNPFAFVRADTFSPERLLLRWAGDFVALTGPLRVRVTVQSENLTVPLAYVSRFAPNSGDVAILRPKGLQAAGLGLQASTVYSYVLEVGAGQAWPFSLNEQLSRSGLAALRDGGLDQLGNNLGFRVIIEPAFAVPASVPAAPSTDLPCDFAVADRADTARFFPVACEPCEASVIGLPPSDAVSLVTPAAEGGCVRTRFFNGMFITREDLETEQRYHRLKAKLHNRAAGAGVVWGLGIGWQGGQVCVAPGYGVDCCGNDLALTTTYRVDGAALIADPAAASLVRQPGARRLCLLLEFVECPSHPRPVHGDPCAPEVSRCEMSRIRESVRLRLVPPRDVDVDKASAPLSRFLAEVAGLRQRFSLDAPAPSRPTETVPFTLDIGVRRPRSDTSSGGQQPTFRLSGLRPGLKDDPDLRERLQSLSNLQAATIRIRVRPDPLWRFVAGTLDAEALTRDGKTLEGVARLATDRNRATAEGFDSERLDVTFALDPQRTGELDRLVLRFSGWRAETVFAAETDPLLSGDFTLALSMSDNVIQEVSFSQERVNLESFQRDRMPWSGEPCLNHRRQGSGKVSADPTPVLPWLHRDPVHPAASGDAKGLLLAAIGAWLMRLRARDGEGTAGALSSARRQVAGTIYSLAWLLLYGLSDEDVRPADLGASLRRLLEGWCDAFLWKGPECDGEPHGVVIGCAIVEGGAIQSVDPFGGRRHVLHSPLLSHWGAQFGLAPLDLSLNRLFSTLCRIAGLPALDGRQGAPPSGLVAMGPGFLAIGAPAALDKAFDERGFDVRERRGASTAELLAEALVLLGRRVAPSENANSDRLSTTFRALVLADVVAAGTVVLLVPEEIAARGGEG
ncbi:MAG: hypothetical protein VKP63_09970 [Cyanobacteriota bacterium]|nr:hypothetical protein [Cyanobacteriota bacterium]